MFTQGFSINGEHSYADYGLHVARSSIGMPTKTSIRKTVPFMSGYYDFSRINGGDTWGERTLTYVFDIDGDTVEETQEEVARIVNWLGGVHEADIYDDTLPEYHFRGSFGTAVPAESDDGKYVELTVTFVCQPFKIANEETVVEVSSGTKTLRNKGIPVYVTVTTVVANNGVNNVTIGEVGASIPSGTFDFPALLQHGVSTCTAALPCTLRWREEVL